VNATKSVARRKSAEASQSQKTVKRRDVRALGPRRDATKSARETKNATRNVIENANETGTHVTNAKKRNHPSKKSQK